MRARTLTEEIDALPAASKRRLRRFTAKHAANVFHAFLAHAMGLDVAMTEECDGLTAHESDLLRRLLLDAGKSPPPGFSLQVTVVDGGMVRVRLEIIHGA